MTLTAADATAGHPATAFWLQVYPPRAVEELGADRLLSAPAWHAERLDDGAVALVVYETPTLYTDASTRSGRSRRTWASTPGVRD